MTRKTRKTSTKSALVAGMLAGPMLAAPAGAADYLKTTAPAPAFAARGDHVAKTLAPATPVAGQEFLKKTTSVEPASFVFSKTFDKSSPNLVDVAGEELGHTVYRDAKGQFFYLDSATGDMKFLTGGHTCCKTTDKVTLLGMDSKGRTLQQNARGEKFYLDAAGNMVDITITK